MGWTCQLGHYNDDPPPGATEPVWCYFVTCSGYRESQDQPGPWAGNTNEVQEDTKPSGDDAAQCPGPHVDNSDYKIDETKGSVKTASSGNKYVVFAKAPKHNTNNKDRPKMPKHLRKKSDLQKYPGTSRYVHQVIVEPLQKMIAAMACEGARIGDHSLQNVTIGSAWRSPSKGKGYLNALKMYLRDHKNCHQNGKKCEAPPKWDKRCSPGFEKLSFPSSLEEEAMSPLGSTSSSKFKTFKTNLGKAGGGWTPAFAEYFLGVAGGWKAPAGGSTHHSGLTIDLDWPVMNGKKEMQLGIDTDYNLVGRKSAAGVWIHEHAATFGFKSYNEYKEIWHMEYVLWKGTAAEPK